MKRAWAARYNSSLLFELIPKGVECLFLYLCLSVFCLNDYMFVCIGDGSPEHITIVSS